MNKRGRGVAILEYPTGMYGGGDPSQAFVKLKPDGTAVDFRGSYEEYLAGKNEALAA